MCRSTRNAVRTAVPPILALGLVALTIRPIGALPAGAAGAALADSQLPATGGQHATCPRHELLDADKDHHPKTHAPARRVPPPRAGNVQVSIPAVAFTERIQVLNGRVRTPVLVNVAEPCGVATVVGSPGACSVVAHPGVVAWLDCALPRKHALVTIEVRLADGTRFTQSGVPTVN